MSRPGISFARAGGPSPGGAEAHCLSLLGRALVSHGEQLHRRLQQVDPAVAARLGAAIEAGRQQARGSSAAWVCTS